MAIFQYEAHDRAGKLIKGTVSGPSLDEARRTLLGRGLQVQALAPAATGFDPLTTPAPALSAPPQPVAVPAPASPPVDDPAMGLGKRGVSLSAHMFFFRQLAAMLAAGVAPSRALLTLSGQTQDSVLRAILVEASEGAVRGEPLSATMDRYPWAFSPVMRAQIKAGEAGGFLERSSREVARWAEEELNLRRLIQAETFVPKLTLASSVIIVLAANGIIGAVGQPGAQRLWSPLTEVATWVVLAPLLVGLYVFVKFVAPRPQVKVWFDALWLNLPIINRPVSQFAMAKFGRAFGALYRSGVLYSEGLKLAAHATGNLYLRNRILPAVDELERGASVSEALEATRAFNPVVMDMLRTGEESGQMDQMLDSMATYYEGEAQVTARNLARVLGVLVLILVAIYVFVVVLSFYAGYFRSITERAGGG